MPSTSLFSWRPHTTFLLLGGFAVILVALVVSYAVQNFKPTTELRIASGVYRLWVADNEAERTQGLSGVEALSPDGGLLMNFASDDYWGIWMKDMKIPLDIVWLDANKEVIYIVKNASPELSTETIMQPTKPARYVIELPVGSVEKSGIRTGQVADFTLTEDAQ